MIYLSEIFIIGELDDALLRKPREERSIRGGDGRLVLCRVERTNNTERDTRYVVSPSSPSGKRLAHELGENRRVSTSTGPDDLDEEDIADSWYDESAQFNGRTLAGKVASFGFTDISVDAIPVWGQKILLLKARR